MEQAAGDPPDAPSPTGARIRVLPPEVVDQIAAGEVVERPASVVKELVENALDAGARRIDVEVAGGGRALIRVVDDGGGMSPEEVGLALARHATSKLRAAEDLFAIGTMGFRGEALPSIAAVSRLSITSRTPDAVGAWRVDVEAGSYVAGRAVGAPAGTTVEVRDLLANVPARHKFLKADATETAHAAETVLRLALAHPRVHFRLVSSGSSSGASGSARTLVEVAPHTSPLERAQVALGRRGPLRLHGADGAEAGVRVVACLGSPSESATTSRATYLFVNRRFVRDRGLLHALGMGYGETLERGRYPLAVLHVEVDPALVDVNVHPQKTEVRFARPQEVQAAVRHVVAEACGRAPWLGSPAAALDGKRGLRVYSLPPAQSAVAYDREAAEDQLQAALALFATPRPSSPAYAPPRSMGLLDGATAREADAQGGVPQPLDDAPTQPWATGAQPAHRPLRQDAFFARLRYLGQLDRTYLVCEGDGELVLVDQHAAHERVAFERLRAAHRRRQLRTQRLLFPVTLELDAARAAAAESDAATLLALGVELEPFGGQTFAVKAVPEQLVDAGAGEIEEVIVEILDQLATRAQPGSGDGDGGRGAQGHEDGPAGEALDLVLATMACHSVVRAGDLLDEARARALLESMDGVDFRAHCPHGRPVLLRLSLGELERRFGRT